MDLLSTMTEYETVKWYDSIETLRLPMRTENTLKHHHLQHIHTLCLKTSRELLALNDMGKLGVRDILTSLAHTEFALKEYHPL